MPLCLLTSVPKLHGTSASGAAQDGLSMHSRDNLHHVLLKSPVLLCLQTSVHQLRQADEASASWCCSGLWQYLHEMSHVFG